MAHGDTTGGPTLDQVILRFAEFVWEERDLIGVPVADDRELLRVARAARERITLGASSGGYCAVVCVPLAAYLSRRGLGAVAVEGGVGGGWQHSWVQLPDGRILDPTGDQFNRQPWAKRLPQIYLGPKPDYYEQPEK